MRRKTILILLGTTATLIAWDVACMAAESGGCGEECTISEILGGAAKKRPVIATAFGVLLGHWFWSLKE